MAVQGWLMTLYQIAPGGARSKRIKWNKPLLPPYTKLLREERDQNTTHQREVLIAGIPNCSGRSEIKTRTRIINNKIPLYQIAPGGARSKQVLGQCCRGNSYTKLLREERDQNS